MTERWISTRPQDWADPARSILFGETADVQMFRLMREGRHLT